MRSEVWINNTVIRVSIYDGLEIDEVVCLVFFLIWQRITHGITYYYYSEKYKNI